MSLSLGKACSEVFLNKYYNLSTVFFVFFLGIYITCDMYCSYLSESIKNAKTIPPETAMLYFFIGLFSILSASIILGYIVHINHKLVKNSGSPIPSVYEFHRIIADGFKFCAGYICWQFMIFIPFIILGIIAGLFGAFLSAAIPALKVVLVIILILISLIYFIFISFKVLIPAILMFFKTLKFTSFFKFGKISEFNNNIKGYYLPYIFKSFIFNLGYGILLCIIFMILSFFLPNTFDAASMIIVSFIFAILFYPLIIVNSNLNAQLISIAYQKI